MSGKRSRTKGHNLEREVVQMFRYIGFKDCITSRAGDRSKDSQGVDLLNTYPLNIQCKNYSKCINYPQVIKEMPKDNFNVIISRVKRKGDYAILTMDDFMELVGILKAEGII